MERPATIQVRLTIADETENDGWKRLLGKSRDAKDHAHLLGTKIIAHPESAWFVHRVHPRRDELHIKVTLTSGLIISMPVQVIQDLTDYALARMGHLPTMFAAAYDRERKIAGSIRHKAIAPPA